MKNKMNKGILALSITSISFVVIATIVVLSLLVYNGNNKDKDDINNPKVNTSLEINKETNNQKNNSEDTESEKETESVTDENVESVDSDSTTTTTATTTTTTIGKPSIVTDVKIPVDVNANKGTTVTTTQKQTTTTTTNKKTTTTTTKKVNTTTTTQKPVVTTTTTAQKPTDPYQQIVRTATITPEQEALIEERIIYYINQFRAEDGVPAAKVLTGKNYQYAKLRSEQLVTNFAHDEDDIHEITKQLQYGQHIVSEETRLDMETMEVIYTGNILDYYQVPCREAIGSDAIGINETIDSLAYSTALMFRQSNPHWVYVGSPDYPYVSVGVTINRGCYSCIAMSRDGAYN